MKEYYKEVIKECREVEQEILKYNPRKLHVWVTIIVGIFGLVIGIVIGMIFL
tara:strand:+ start:471 stop:626 length:156 start_codon:yes stop_codon:yes gene_type:complete